MHYIGLSHDIPLDGEHVSELDRFDMHSCLQQFYDLDRLDAGNGVLSSVDRRDCNDLDQFRRCASTKFLQCDNSHRTWRR